MNSSPVMQQHDPNDDPFAELSKEMDKNQLVSPLEFGSGAVKPAAEDHTDSTAEESTASETVEEQPTEQTAEQKEKEETKKE